MKDVMKAFFGIIWECIKLIFWLCLLILVSPLIVAIMLFNFIVGVSNKRKQMIAIQKQEEMKMRKIQEQEEMKRAKLKSMADDLKMWLSKEKNEQNSFYADIIGINKLQRELSQYKSTKGKLIKNKELLAVIEELLKEVEGARKQANELKRLTYSPTVHGWLKELDEIEFKFNDSKVACEERIKRLEKKLEKEQPVQNGKDMGVITYVKD